MAITRITLTTDRTNYSKYDPDFHVITALAESDSTGDDPITFALQRRARTGPGGARTTFYTLATIIVDTASDGSAEAEFDLTTLYDANGFYTGRCSISTNDWQVVATNGNVNTPAVFSVLAMTVDEMRNRWLLGLPLITIERLEPAFQPQVVTGVTIDDVSFNSLVGGQPLTYTPAAGLNPATLQWGGGTPVPLVPGVEEYTLITNVGGTIDVTVVQSELPDSAATENIFINYGRMPDSSIIKQIIAETRETEKRMHMHLEPTLVVGVPTAQYDAAAPTVYDEIAEAITYYKPWNLNQWLHIETPFPGLLKVVKLQGFMNMTLVTNIDASWIKPQEQSGKIDLVPSNAAILNWYLYGPGLYTIFFNYVSVPGFWSFLLLTGLREMKEPIRDYIGMRTAIVLMSQAALARYPAGVSGYSIARDGVSESRSISPGVYKENILIYERILGRNDQGNDQMLMDLRDDYRGPISVTL
jgi:hypothetical protein